MHPILKRYVHGLAILFLALQAMTAILLFYYEDAILIPKWRALAGLFVLFALTAVVFGRREKQIVGAGLAAGLFLPLISVFFLDSHPMHQYAAVRHTNTDGYIESDEVYLRSSSVVRMLEPEGFRIYKNGERRVIERYLYSARIGLLLGKSLAEGKENPGIGYEIYGISAWLFGARVACEQFTFFAINLTPLLIAYGLYCQWRKKPPKDSVAVEPVGGVFLAGPFLIGLIPLIGP
jgi:hypothetical protein